ncbi:MAG: Gx transporter family protein [Holdemanella sp.]|nr:Gx transporter family protein [Holdemanella sp.]
MSTKKIALRSLLIALALVFSYIEAQIPAFVAIPGMKLGLTNLVIVVALYKLSSMDAIVLNLIRVFIVGITFGNGVSMLYAMSGAILSFITMVLLKKFTSLHVVAISVAGGIMHNVGQILVAMMILESSKLLWYLPFLWASGIVSGAIIGIVSGLTIKRLPDIK